MKKSGKVIFEITPSEQELKTSLMKLIEYFSRKDIVAIKKGNKIYHFNVETLG